MRRTSALSLSKTKDCRWGWISGFVMLASSGHVVGYVLVGLEKYLPKSLCISRVMENYCNSIETGPWRLVLDKYVGLDQLFTGAAPLAKSSRV
jgi:hypothetical protein